MTTRPVAAGPSTRAATDVVVVGGGPGGAATAAPLASAGLAVTILDRQQFPRDKVCGDFVGPAALSELHQLGIGAHAAFRATNKIRRAALFLDGTRQIVQPMPKVDGLPAFGRTIPRQALDAWVLEAAQDRGAAVVEGARVTGFTPSPGRVEVAYERGGTSCTIGAAVLVGADGSSSTVARAVRGAMPPKQDRIMAVRAYLAGISGPEDRADLFFSGDALPGYSWLFPLGEGMANVGVGMLVDTTPPSDEGLRALLERLLRSDAGLAARAGEPTFVGRIVGWPLTTYNPREPLVRDRLVLVGDAAGLINPLNGEGIQYALQSGRWAAEAIVGALADGRPTAERLGSYERRVEKELRFDMALAATVVQLIRNRSLNPIWLEAMRVISSRARRDPAYAQVVGGILAGLLPASGALRPELVAATLAEVVTSIATGTGHAELADDVVRAMVRDARADPVRVAQWGLGLVAQLAELGTQALRPNAR